MGQIEVCGPRSAELLDMSLVGWISKVVVGRAKYTMMCGPTGTVVDDLVVYRLDEHTFLVVANASNHAAVLDTLAGLGDSLDVEVVDRSATDALVAIQGPVAEAVLQPLTTTPLSTLRYYAITRAEIRHVPVKIARTGYTGEDGFEIYVNQREAAGIWATLLSAGSSSGLLPTGLVCRDTLRLEAGMPLYGHELDDRTTPFAAGLGRVVSLDKPADFVGRTALEAAAASLPDRVLVGIELDGPRAARQGHAVVHAATDEAAGIVTSGAPSPTLGHPIALAYVDRSLAELDTAVAVDVRGRREPARVVSLPFYRRTI
jgi:aminomethyltransferase